jgi:hypothetical protein
LLSGGGSGGSGTAVDARQMLTACRGMHTIAREVWNTEWCPVHQLFGRNEEVRSSEGRWHGPSRLPPAW